MSHFTTEEITKVFDTKYCDPGSDSYLSIQRIGEPAELLAGTVFHFDVEHQEFLGCAARVYAGLSHHVAQRLWMQEAQSLVRLSAARHPALPRIVDAKFSEIEQIGVVISESTGQTLTREDLKDLRQRPADALRYFALIADALRVIHGRGLIHRDVWRESFEFVGDSSGGRRLRLLGFEMSAFSASLSDPEWRTNKEDREVLRRYRDRGGVDRRACRAPEVLEGERGSSTAGISFRSDIFSLGVCGFQWFVDDLPESLADAENPEAIASWVDGHLSRAARIPKQIRELLREMISIRPANRPTASDVVNRLATAEDEIVLTSRTERPDAYVVSIAPSFLQQFIQVPRWLPLPAEETRLFHYLREQITRDLEDAVLLYQPEGAVGMVTGGDTNTQAAAQWVLIGRAAVYFCQRFRADVGVGRTRELHWVMHASYIVDRAARNLRDIGSVPLRRRVPRVKVVHYLRSPEVRPDADERLGCPSWSPLLDEVFTTQHTRSEMADVRKGYEWWLHVRRAQIENETYAFRRVTEDFGTGVRTVRLAYDTDRNRKWIEDDSIRELLAGLRRGRPSFGDFFGSLTERKQSAKVRWLRDRDGRPDWDSQDWGTGEVKSARASEVVIEVTQGTPPAAGWLRSADGGAEDTLLWRQTIAVSSFFNQPDLMEALYEPYSIRGPRARWEHAGIGLKGNASSIVKDMLAFFPFYALQGPPGTGKTKVVSHAVSAYVKEHPGARVLVSAQSHYALDELAERIIDKAEISPTSEVVAVRVATDYRQPRESMQRYLDAAQAAQRLEAIENRSKRLARSHYGKNVKQLAAEWGRLAKNNLWEIQHRISRSANIVFATTGTCTDRIIGSEMFDWVIVEEAAKAWCAELVMPLVFGHNWTLVGDHKQLPPFGDETIDSVYQACLASRNLLVKNLVSDSSAFASTLKVFESLFTPRPPGRDRPLNRLEMQFRMDDRILSVVRDTFYPPPEIKLESAPQLKTSTSLHGLTQPSYVKDQALIWLDTGDHPNCRYEQPHWSNPGEAEQVRRLVNILKPAITRADDPLSIAVLSPYHHQNELLRRGLSTEIVQTTDSFQGREADIVIVSLVRTNGKAVDEPLARIGHVSNPPRANVLLSRAKRLLIIVGDFTHFASTVGSVWADICKHVRTYGKVVPAQ